MAKGIRISHDVLGANWVKNNKPTKTYIDLYHQLSELNSEQLTQTVSIYDKDVEDFSHADSTLININNQIHIGI